MYEAELPSLPASAAAPLWDERGHLLVLDPTYKSGWTLPGGVMEADGETPWEACVREVHEETGITVTQGRLVCVDTRPAKVKDGVYRKLGLRIVFDCGVVSTDQQARIRLQPEEIGAHRFVTPQEALSLLRKPVRRRVHEIMRADGEFVYLENGRRADGAGA